MMGARANCAQHFIGLGSGKDEFDVGRGFFYHFEQRIEALFSDHVRFVNDEYFEPVPRWGESCAFPQVTGGIYAAVRCRIDLYHIY